MAFHLIWTRTAAEDLREIAEFIANENPDAARRLGQAILGKVEQLPQFPKMGRTIPEKEDPALRELILSPYRIIYRLDHDQKAIYVTRIWHAARGIPET
jgi:addiction module RelE/StbE family toxin